MNLELRITRPLFYLYLPVLLVLVFVGFPPPFAPPHRTKPGQEHSEIVKKRVVREQGEPE